MAGYKHTGSSICALLIAAAAAAAGMHIAARGQDNAPAVAGNERISLYLHGNGSLGIRQDDGKFMGLRWPGRDGIEFLGGGGIFVRYRPEGASTHVQLTPASFEAVDLTAPHRILREGCSGGRRYPQRGYDDDEDGLADEDRCDGIDNDGDGLVDEDFAAIGDRMVVDRSIEPVSGLRIIQSSYAWSYGHVRDFIGFTTRLEYPKRTGGRSEKLAELEAALYVDFDIGDPDNDRRGEDDRFFVLTSETGGLKREEEPFACIAASDKSQSSVFAAVIVLDAVGPDGAAIAYDGLVIDAGWEADSVWTAEPLCGATAAEATGVRIVPGGVSSGEQGARLPGGLLKGDLVPPDAYDVRGNKAIVHRFESVADFKTDDSLEISWAVVFGKTREALRVKAHRAIETYRGMIDGSGRPCRWVVPARKVAKRNLEAGLAAVWIRGTRQPTAAMALPPDLEPEDVEWLKVGDVLTEGVERVGCKLLVPLDRTLVETKAALDIIGQMTDGTIFTASLDSESLRACTGNDRTPQDRLPEECLQLYPNPFLTTLNIDLHVLSSVAGYERAAPSGVDGLGSVRIYDVRGRLVRTVLEEEFLPPGDFKLTWDGRDANGSEVAPGVYYCKLQIGSRSLTKRVILLR